MSAPRDYTYAYIRGAYQVPAAVGGRIEWQGKRGRLVSSQTDQQYLHVRFDGEKRTVLVHPTDDVIYLDGDEP